MSIILKIFSLGITATVLRSGIILSRLFLAREYFFPPSNLKGIVKMPKTMVPASRPIRANSGAAPDPAPPPKEATKIHKSMPWKSLAILALSSLAAFWPSLASMPQPSPPVIFCPNCKTLVYLDASFKALKSVLATTKSTFFKLRAISETIEPPPPPTPITLILVRWTKSKGVIFGFLFFKTFLIFLCLAVALAEADFLFFFLAMNLVSLSIISVMIRKGQVNIEQ